MNDYRAGRHDDRPRSQEARGELMDMPELIIDRPELQPRVQRTMFQLITVAAWSAYLYLWLPLATLALWWLALRVGMQEVANWTAPGYIDTAVFAILLKAAIAAAAVLLGWAEYNRMRFQGRDRRGPRPVVTPEQTAASMGIRQEIGADLRRARHATLHIDEHARPVGVTVHQALAGADDDAG